jgi:hypothetical protein
VLGGGDSRVVGGFATGGPGGQGQLIGGQSSGGAGGDALVRGGQGSTAGGDALVYGGQGSSAAGGDAVLDAGPGAPNGDVAIGETYARRVFIGRDGSTAIAVIKGLTKRYDLQTVVASDTLRCDYDFNLIGSAGAVSLSATTPIAAVPQSLPDYGGAVTREVTFFNGAGNNITVPAGGNVLVPGGVNLVVAPQSSFTVIWVESLLKWAVTNVGAAVA